MFFRNMKNTLSPLVAYKRSRSLDSSNWYMGSLLTFLAESKDTGGSFTLIEGLLKPGNEPPPHVHGREDELFYILEGEMDMYVGNEVFKAGAGECLFLPGLSRTLSLSGLLGSALLSCSCPVDSRIVFARGVRVRRSSSCHPRLLPIQLPISNP